MQGSSVRCEAGGGEPRATNRAWRLAARWAGGIHARPALWLAAGLLAAALSSPATADQVITNGGFETGSFNGWNAGIRPSALGGGMPYFFNTPSGWVVSNQTQTDGTLSLDPIHGFSAFNGFEGSPAGLQFFLNQGFSFNSTVHNAPLSFTFDIVGGPLNKDAKGRKFEVVITSMSGFDRAKVFQYVVTGTDANPRQTVNLDIRSALNSIGPGGYMLEFRETIPEANTGPALFVIDDVSLDIQQNCGPKPTCPPDQTIECAGPLTMVALHGSAHDLENDPLTFVWTEGNVTLGTGPDIIVKLSPGKHTITLMVSDTFGGMGMCTFMITIVPSKPKITCPADVVVCTDMDKCTATLTLPTVTATSDCSPPVTVQCTRADGKALTDPYPFGTTKINCTATDAAGNTDTCSFNVCVYDCRAPNITCPANIMVQSGAGQCGAIVPYPNPLVSDNCPGVTATCNPPSGYKFPVGMTTVTCKATDASGNMNTCTFTVTVTPNPGSFVFKCNDVSKSVPEGVKCFNVNFDITLSPGATLMMCVDETGKVVHSGDCFMLTPGQRHTIHTITCIAKDACGNIMTCTFQIHLFC